jgi:hypothetical protein
MELALILVLELEKAQLLHRGDPPDPPEDLRGSRKDAVFPLDFINHLDRLFCLSASAFAIFRLKF